MKQAILSVLITFGSCVLFAQATEQTTSLSMRKNIVTFSYNPALILIAPFLDNSTDNNRFSVIHGKYGIRAVYYRYENSGIFSLAYGRHVHEQIVLMINLSYQQVWRKWDLYVDAHSPHHFTERFHHFLIMPEVRANWFTSRDGSTTLSSGIGFGIRYLHQNVGRFGDVIPAQGGVTSAFHLSVFGLQGNIQNFTLNFNLGIGARGFLELGIGYRF
ncbi:MAG: hypothetical protein FWD02_01220 [Bacteroidales bacterium]|nr:hypothetical protein [Bacteroidales bacterium]